MSLFDSIRYPLSIPPSVEQLENLPPWLYYQLHDSIFQGKHPKQHTPDLLFRIIRIMLKQPANREHTVNALTNIRNEILELP